MKYLLISMAVFILSSCSALTNDYEKYSTAMSAHSSAEALRISAQASAIADAANVEGATKTEAVLLSAIAMMQIERLAFSPLNLKAPVTGYEVLNTAVGHLPFFFSTYGMYRLGTTGIKNAGNISLNGETLNVSDSFGRTETQTIGDGNATTISNERDHSVDNSDHSQ